MGLLSNLVKTKSSYQNNQSTEWTAGGLQVQSVTDNHGKWVGVRVRRGDYTLDYHRTNRTGFEIFDHPEGELHTFFTSCEEFASVMKGKSILDIGCGGGALVEDLREQSVHAVGLDLLPGKGSHLIQGDAFNLPFKANSFDCIVSVWSVFKYEPLHQTKRLLEEAFSVLKPNGRILLSSLHDPVKVQLVRNWCEKNKAHLFAASGNLALQIIKR